MPDINGIPYVESSDLVSAYPTVSQDLAQEVGDQLASKLDLAGGKILQIVRATDTTDRTTTSTSLTDVTGMSVTITPSSATSSIMVIGSFASRGYNAAAVNNVRRYYALTDSSNTFVSGGAELAQGQSGYTTSANSQDNAPIVLIGWDSPATTSATTYKLRFRSHTTDIQNTVYNSSQTAGQMFAIEVSA